jgi:hypothetical protein
VVERSIDGRVFVSVGTIGAKGNSALANIYTFSDDIGNLNAKTVYYRLKQVDKSLAAKLSNTLSFNLAKRGGMSLVIAPNPARSYFTLQVNAVKEGPAMVRMLDLFGRVMEVRATRLSAGTNTLNFDNLAKYSHGTYSVQLIMDGKVFSQKLLVGR